MVTEQISELEHFIRFRLSLLSEQNEHHTFEEIATRIARRRVSANILVANGPVSAGGDQQRDAESYTTYIPEELPHSAGFSASASRRPVVLACTVQTTGLKAKILADVGGICATEADEVSHIAFFSVASVPEAITHALKKVVRDEHGVTLDVFSGKKLAVLLAEPDLVWVARHYLNVPASLIPPEPEGKSPEWYRELLDDLRGAHGPRALTPATQGEIARGLGHATWDADANADLPEWLDFMGAFLADGVSDDLVFRACYEMAVARFRGQGVATGVDDLVRRALAHAMTSSRADLLDDSTTLVGYWANMWVAGVTDTEASEIGAARDGLQKRILAELATTDRQTYPVRTATLLGALTFLSFSFRCELAEARGDHRRRVEVDPLAGKSLDETEVDVSGMVGTDLFDLDGAMSYLGQLVDVLPSARPYPARSISRVFNLFAPALVEQPTYSKVRDGLDAAMAIVDSDAAIAERCRDRAFKFAAASNFREALREAHKAKAHWFHGELIHGAVLTCRYIGHLYEVLGLDAAAKMYYFAAAMTANQTTDDSTRSQVPIALFAAADVAHGTGAWVDASALTRVALLAHRALTPDPLNIEAHPDLERHAQNGQLMLAPVRKFWPELESLIRAALDDDGWFEYITDPLELIELPFTEDEYQGRARNQLSGPVFSDLGPERTIDFEALGVRWTFTFDNDQLSVLAAEEFVAAFQIVIADIADQHPVLLSTTVRTRLELVSGKGIDPHKTVVVDDLGDDVTVGVYLPNEVGTLDDHTRVLSTTVLHVLMAAHARPPRELLEMLKPLFRDGLTHKIMFGRPYRESADFLATEHYLRCHSGTPPASSAGFVPQDNDHLPAATNDGPEYDRAEALARIRQRYRTADAWHLSLARLLSDEETRSVMLGLREDGWLDWQIAMGIAILGLNWRMRGRPHEGLTPRDLREIGSRIEESTDELLPLDFVVENIHDAMLMMTANVASSWGVRGRPPLARQVEVRDLLNRRYRFGRDDLPHRDLFECQDAFGRVLPFLG